MSLHTKALLALVNAQLSLMPDMGKEWLALKEVARELESELSAQDEAEQEDVGLREAIKQLNAEQLEGE